MLTITDEEIIALKTAHGRLFKVVVTLPTGADCDVVFRGPSEDEYTLMTAARERSDQNAVQTLLRKMIVWPADKSTLPVGVVNNEDFGLWFAKFIGQKSKSSGEL